MPKSENLVLLISMLTNRRSTNIETIARECNVSKRTAFRYMRSLESAGYPVYYDEEYSGYRLANRSAKVQQFTQVEAALLIIALGMIEGALTTDSLSIIQRIRVKLEASIPYSEQRNLGLHLDSQLFRANNGQVRDQVLLSLIDLAKRMGKRLRLVHSERNSSTACISEIDPNLRFERGWLIEDRDTGKEPASIPVSSIIDLEMI